LASAGVAEAATEAGTGMQLSHAKLDYVRRLFKDIIGIPEPPNLDVFLAVLQGLGADVLDEDGWRKIGGDLHPFLLPLAAFGTLDDDVEVIGLLFRQPNGAPLPANLYQVITQKPRKSLRLDLKAVDIPKYIARAAEEANFRKDKQDMPIIEATRDAYDIKFKGNDRFALDKWLLLEVGAFPEIYKNLCGEHVSRGDVKTGLVIADTMRDTFGAAWGFPHAFVCRVMKDNEDSLSFKNADGQTVKREQEAEHSAQRCFTAGYPLWSLEDEGDSIEDLLLKAQMPRLGSLDMLRVFYLKRASDEQRAAVRTGSISNGCAALAKAQALMDAVCCGHKSFNGIRLELINLYEEVPGCEPLVEMIGHFRRKE